MSKPVSIPSTFQNQSGPIPLSQLDNNFTQVAAAINDFGTYGNYLIDISGAANQLTVATPVGTTFGYVAGVGLQVKVAVTTTLSTVNINVNTLGNQLILNSDGSSLTVGQFIAGQIISLIYDGANFRVFGQTSTSGTFTGTLTGCTTAPTLSFTWTKVGNLVTISSSSGLMATSNSTVCSITGLPASISPATNYVLQPTLVYNNSVQCLGFVQLLPTTTTLIIYAGIVSGANVTLGSFVSSGTKGLNSSFGITYSVA